MLFVIYCYQPFSFFSFSVHANVLKLYKSTEQLYLLLFRNSKNRITSSQCLKLLSSCTQHTKQNKQRNKNFKWTIQFLTIAIYTFEDVRQINGQRRETTKSYWKKMSSVEFSAYWIAWFLVWVLSIYTSFQVSIKSKFSNDASINFRLISPTE